jgi:hypothetical protein
MRLVSAIMSVGVLASIAVAGGIGSPQQCRQTLAAALGQDPSGKQLLRTVNLFCQDGDPRCDRDGACDGKCTVAVCITRGHYIHGCPYLDAGFCPSGTGDEETLSVGQRQGEGSLADGNYYLFTRFTVRCRRAAPHCN